MTKNPKNLLARDYILIDIETNSNGLQANHQDEIIDIAAIKICTNGSFTEFSTRVKILGKLKPFAKFLTGIKDKELNAGISLDLAINNLEEFIGDLPLVGHNIKRFDLPVLKNYSTIIEQREIYDTIELALFLDPANKDGHSVQKYLHEIKGKSYTEKHQALFDCWDEQIVLEYLLNEKLEQNWGNKLSQLKKTCEYLKDDPMQWGEIIHQLLTDKLVATDDEILNLLPANYFSTVKKSNSNSDSKSDDNEVYHISADEINNIFAGKNLGKSFTGNFEERPEQLKLAQVIAEGISNGKHVVAEAETGVGKTLAYLIPAILYTIKSKRKTIIATKTKLLQDQIMYDDLPKANKLFPAHSFKTANLKGRENYVCLQKCADYLENYQFNKSRNSFLNFKTNEISAFSEKFAKVLISNWLILNQDGDLEKFPFYISKHAPNGLNIKSNLKSIKGQCLNQICPYFKYCFIRKNREEAKQADIIITNYNLILSDLLGVIDHAYISNHAITLNDKDIFITDLAPGSLTGAILPEFNTLIFDEAHNLENIATEALTFKFSQQILKNICLELSSYEIVGSIPKQLRFLPKNEVSQTLLDLLLQNNSLYFHVANIWASLNDSTIIQTKINNELNYTGDHGYNIDFQLNAKDIKNPAWSEISQKCINLNLILKKLKNEIKTINDEAIEINFVSEENYKTFKNIVNYIVELIDFMYHCLHYLAFLEIDHQQILVQVTAERNSDVSIYDNIFSTIADFEFSLIPIDISDLLYQKLWLRLHHSTLISATLSSTNKNFNLIQSITGFSKSNRVNTVCETSPFNYANHALLLHLADFPSCKSKDYALIAIEFLKKILVINQGRALVLCTTKKDVEYIYNHISETCDENNVSVLAQNAGDADSMGNKKLIDYMRENNNMVLIGTNTLHEGIDIPGSNLDLVIIWKLPFLVPSPLVRAKKDKNYDYYMEKSVARFRQQCGRLIRSKDDKGHIIVLDNRFPNSDFVKALPSNMLKLLFYSASIEKLLGNWANKRDQTKITPRENLYEVFPEAKTRFAEKD